MEKEYEIDLPSGAKLKFNLAPFEDGQELFHAVVSEFKGIAFTSDRDMAEVFKDLSVQIFSSKRIDLAVKKCLQRARYNDLKVTPQTFEPSECRSDYYPAALAVLQENMKPFMSGLMQALPQFLKTMGSYQV